MIMEKLHCSFKVLIALGLLLAFAAPRAEAQFSTGETIVYTYFLEDPVSSIHFAWIAEDIGPASLEFRRSGSSTWHRRSTTRQAEIPGSEFMLREVRLSSLHPGTAYVIRLEGSENEYRIRTLPDTLDRPLSFVTGGDMYTSAIRMREVSTHAAAKDPWFAAIGGDWAYADGNPAQVSRWFRMMEIWQETMVTTTGHLVPFVPAIGNHEVQGGYGVNPDLAPLYYTFFGKPDRRGYYAMDAGDYLSIIVLDSNHTSSVSGKQKEWLQTMLSERRRVEHVFPIYHVAGWPSFRDPELYHPTQVNRHWVPIFENYGLGLVFENHDHTFKRTKPIRNNSVDEDGVVYIGDGAWGVTTREPASPSDRWYLEKSSAENHFWQVTISRGTRVMTAINISGEIIDQFTQETELTPQYEFVREVENPARALLSQNHPNPFNSSTRISFYIPEGGGQTRAHLEVFNISGRRVATVADGRYQPGSHSIMFNADDVGLSSGIYIFRLRHGDTTISRKMNLVK